MKLQIEREKIVATGKKLLADGVIHDGQGNFSVFNRESGLVAITPSAVPYNERTPEDICVVDLDGNMIEGKWKSTSETFLHLIYYQKRTDVNAVIHTHALKSTVFGIIGKEPMPMVLNEASMGLGGSVPIAPYARPGTKELAEVTFNAVGDGFAAIMAHHGLITMGDTIEHAYFGTLAAEATADVLIMAHSMDARATVMDDEEVKILRGIFMGYKPTKVSSEK